MKTKLTLALMATLTSTAFAAFQAPLPEFKNEKQLAEWRAEKASQSNSQGYAAEDAAFYTGRPYLASSGGYTFKYRSYDPALSRWTSEDPSGFPEGANNQMYVSNSPLSSFDFLGLVGKSALIVTFANLFSGQEEIDYISLFNSQYADNKTWMREQDAATSGTSSSTRYLSDGDIFDKHVVSSMSSLSSIGDGYDKVFILTHGEINPQNTYRFMGPDGNWYEMSSLGNLNAVMMTCYNSGAGGASGTGATGWVSTSSMIYSANEQSIKYLYE